MLYSPETLLPSIRKYENVILEKSGLSKEDFETLLSLILENIEVIEKGGYENYLEEADKILGHIDKEDVSYIALALSRVNDRVWSDDRHFQQQKRIKIWKTEDVTKLVD